MRITLAAEPVARTRRLTRVFDRCPASIQVVDRDGLTTYVNDAWLDLFGFADSSALIRRLNLRTAPVQPWLGLRHALAGALTGRETDAPELAAAGPGGETVWLRATLTPLCDAAGQVESVVIQYERLSVAITSPAGRRGQNPVAALDETARLFGAQHEVDAILCELAHGATAIGDLSRCVVATYDPDRTLLIGRAASVAPGALGLAALTEFRVDPAQAPLTRAALAGKPQVACPGMAEFVPPLGGEDMAAGPRFGRHGLLVMRLQAGDAPLGALYVEAGPEQSGFTSEEVDLAGALVRQTALALGAARLHAHTGSLLTQVADAKARLDAVINSASEGILLLDTAGQVLIANPFVHTLYGVAPGRLVGASLAALRERLASAFAANTDLTAAFPAEHNPEAERVSEYRLARPRPRIVRQITGPVYDRVGALLGQIIVMHDITAEHAALRAQDELLRVASHELKTPVTSIKGFGQLMQREFAAPAGTNLDRARRHLARMLGQLDRLTALVNELLDVSRIETGRLELHLESCDLAMIVTEVIERQLFSDASAPRQIRFAGELGTFVGEWDPGRIDQVVTNLLDNAVKYSSADSVVQIALSEQEGQAHLAISDAGIGIPAGQLAGLFTPFARATNVAAQAYPGIGLGLYIVRRITEQHDGRAWAESSEGRGSTFHVVLPLAKRD
ncbi:MAG: ATP-binding protein [Thermomicrobiales bacterium]